MPLRVAEKEKVIFSKETAPATLGELCLLELQIAVR